MWKFCAWMDACECPSMQVCKHAGTQACKYAHMQVCSASTSMQVHNTTDHRTRNTERKTHACCNGQESLWQEIDVARGLPCSPPPAPPRYNRRRNTERTAHNTDLCKSWCHSMLILGDSRPSIVLSPFVTNHCGICAAVLLLAAPLPLPCTLDDYLSHTSAQMRSSHALCCHPLLENKW